MKQTDKRFGIAWFMLLLLAIVICITERWSDDTVLLIAAYTLTLLSAWLFHRIRPRTAFVNLIVMIAYNVVLGYNIIFNSRYGAGMTWWFVIMMLNTIQSIILLVYSIVIKLRTPKYL